MNTKNPWIPAIVMSTVALTAGIGIGVYAQTAPSATYPLYYSGAIEADGKSPTGKYAFKIEVWDREVEGTPLCTKTDPNVDVIAGRFRVDLSSCTEKIRASKDAWVQISFTGPDSLTRDIVQRSRVGASPFALEAEHAVSCDAAKNAPVITAWASYKPTVRTQAGEPTTFDTAGSRWRRVGDSVELYIQTKATGGGASKGTWNWTLPEGIRWRTGSPSIGHGVEHRHAGPPAVSMLSVGSWGADAVHAAYAAEHNWAVGNLQTYNGTYEYALSIVIPVEGWTVTGD